MSIFITKEENIKGLRTVSSVEQDYVPQHPVMKMSTSVQISKRERLELYEEAQEGNMKMHKEPNQCETKRSDQLNREDFESSEIGVPTFLANGFGLIKGTRKIQDNEEIAFKKAFLDFFESDQTNLHVHRDRSFRCDAFGQNCEEGMTYTLSNADYSARHDAEPYQDGAGFAHVRPEHDFALFVTNETYMGTGANDYNATVGATEENGLLRARMDETTMLDGRTLKYHEDLSLPGTAIYIAAPNDLVSLRTLVIGFRGSRFDFADASARWDWLLSDAIIGLGIPFQEAPRFKYSEQHVLRLLLDSNRFDQVIFTGHSLGGTLANSIYHQLHDILPPCSGSIIFNAGCGFAPNNRGHALNTASYRMLNDPVSGSAIKILPDISNYKYLSKGIRLLAANTGRTGNIPLAVELPVIGGSGRLDGIVTRNSVSFDSKKNGWSAHVMGNFLPSTILKRNDGAIISGNNIVRERIKLLSIMRSLWMHNDKDFLSATRDIDNLQKWSVSMLHDSLADFCATKIAIEPNKIYIDRMQETEQLKAEICVLAHAGTGNVTACQEKFKAKKVTQHNIADTKFFQQGQVTKTLDPNKIDLLDLTKELPDDSFLNSDQSFDDNQWQEMSTLSFDSLSLAAAFAGNGEGVIMNSIEEILEIKYVAENPNPQDATASTEFLKQKKELNKNFSKSTWQKSMTLTKLKLREDKTSEGKRTLTALLMAQDIVQMQKSGLKNATVRERFGKFNMKRVAKLTTTRDLHWVALYLKYGGPLSRAGYKSLKDLTNFIVKNTKRVFEAIKAIVRVGLGFVSNLLDSAVYYIGKGKDWILRKIKELTTVVSAKLSVGLAKFRKDKNWIALKKFTSQLIPTIANITGCLLELAKEWILKPLETTIMGTHSLKVTAFAVCPLLVLVYDPETGERRNTMQNVNDIIRFTKNMVSSPYTGEALTECGTDEIDEKRFHYVLYSPNEKNVGNSFPLLLEDYKPPFSIGDVVRKVGKYKQLVHFPCKEFEVLSMSESGRTITVKPTSNCPTRWFHDEENDKITQKEYPAKYFHKVN